MRDYGKVYTAFWTSEDARSLSEDGRILALYLLTCPHGNMIGCFRLTNAYAADDLMWPIERVSKGFGELFRKGYAYRCERSFWVVINRYLKWNQFENPNVGKAAGKLFEVITPPHDVKALLVKALREFATTFPKEILEKFETLSIPFRNPSVLSPETVVVVGAVVGVGNDTPTAAPKKPRTPAKTSLPNDFRISDRVRAWATEKGYTNLDRHLENFISACRAKGYQYVDWDESFMGAIRNNWAKIEAPRLAAVAGYVDPRWKGAK